MFLREYPLSNEDERKRLIREGAFGSVYCLKERFTQNNSTHEIAMKDQWPRTLTDLYQLRNELLITELCDMIENIRFREGRRSCFLSVYRWLFAYNSSSLQAMKERKLSYPWHIRARMYSPCAKEDGLRLLRRLSPSIYPRAIKELTVMALGSIYMLYQMGIQHRDLKSNNVLCFSPLKTAFRTDYEWVHLWGVDVYVPTLSKQYVLIDFGASKLLRNKLQKEFGGNLRSYDTNRRPVVEISAGNRRPEAFLTVSKQGKVRLANPLRFGGVLPLLGDVMMWFGSCVVLMQQDSRITVSDNKWAARGLAITQWAELRTYYLLSNENYPDVIDPPSVLGRKYIISKSFRDRVTKTVKGRSHSPHHEVEAMVLGLVVQELFNESNDAYSPTDTRYVLSPLEKQVLEAAIENGMMTARPGTGAALKTISNLLKKHNESKSD